MNEGELKTFEYHAWLLRCCWIFSAARILLLGDKTPNIDLYRFLLELREQVSGLKPSYSMNAKVPM
jgi:hypothetical protein